MKKLICLGMVIIMSFLLVACGNKEVVIEKDDENGTKTEIEKFEGKDVYGNDIDSTIFSEYKVTVVTIWATYCSPCLYELPELEKLYQKLPEGSNMITVCIDAKNDVELTKEVLESVKATYTTLVSNEILNNTWLKNLTGTPTTIFVNNKGKIVGTRIIGVPVAADELVETYLDLIEDLL